ncbi:hypothetical protein C7271_16465 [filamentous cyanobacterium CCP5]|nr:hypothetical protein C7271_16465 [filamentous cyanobacterium CCP5]
MNQLRHNHRQAALMGLLASLLVVPPVFAQSANFASLSVGPGSPSASTNGYTAGFFPLSNIAGRDRQGNVCTGFATQAPDHILVLQQDMASLAIQVDSGGNDTTLMIQGPEDGTIRCGQDTSRRNTDARIADENWRAGTYRIWVGTHTQGQRYSYTLSTSQ